MCLNKILTGLDDLDNQKCDNTKCVLQTYPEDDKIKQRRGMDKGCILRGQREFYSIAPGWLDTFNTRPLKEKCRADYETNYPGGYWTEYPVREPIPVNLAKCPRVFRDADVPGCSIASIDGKTACYPHLYVDPDNPCDICNVIANPLNWTLNTEGLKRADPARRNTCDDKNISTKIDLVSGASSAVCARPQLAGLSICVILILR